MKELVWLVGVFFQLALFSGSFHLKWNKNLPGSLKVRANILSCRAIPSLESRKRRQDADSHCYAFDNSEIFFMTFNPNGNSAALFSQEDSETSWNLLKVSLVSIFIKLFRAQLKYNYSYITACAHYQLSCYFSSNFQVITFITFIPY